MSEDEKNRTHAQREDWVNRHMQRSSVETAERLLTTAQPPPPADAPTLRLRGVRARCVAGGASNFWIIGSNAGEPTLAGDYPLVGTSPSAYFIQAPEYNFLPYAVRRADLTAENHIVIGDISKLEARMREVYGE
jgi:hypothetical protein